MLLRTCCYLTVTLIAASLQAQQKPARQAVLINSYNPGAISIPTDHAGWKIDYINVYDDGTRPVLQLSNEQTGITASVTLFDNYYKKPTATGCRKDATDGILQNQAAAITGRKDSLAKASDGTPLALTTWVLHGNPATIRQRNLFAFASDAQTCYEIHVSKVIAGKPVDAELQRAMRQFKPIIGYKPGAMDYFFSASLLFRKAPALAVPYYKQALERIPADAQSLTMHRVVTDQLVLSLGMSGNLKESRATAQHAIEADPDYPLNYYHLACADAEEGNAAGARTHLEQAFARKQNILKGERMPDPSTDDSLLKLKTNAEFWAFAQTLH